MKDPIRLSDDPSLSPDIRELLRGGGEAPPAMDPAAHAATSAALAKLGAAQVATTVVSAKFVIVSVLVGVGVTLGTGALMTEPVADTEVQVHAGVRSEVAAASANASEITTPQEVLPAASPVENASQDEPESRPVEVVPPARRSASAPPDVDRLTLEAALLERARQALADDPRAALAQANRHAREYPRGQLASARELIAIDALRRLHRERQAIRRAEALIARDPHGIHAARARAILAELTSPPSDSFRDNLK